MCGSQHARLMAKQTSWQCPTVAAALMHVDLSTVTGEWAWNSGGRGANWPVKATTAACTGNGRHYDLGLTVEVKEGTTEAVAQFTPCLQNSRFMFETPRNLLKPP